MPLLSRPHAAGFLRGHPLLSALAFAALAATTWAALAPIHVESLVETSSGASRDEIFVIPKGTWARRMAGEKNEILPDHIRLVLGVRDILVLKNSDDVPQIFGPTLMMPGQSLRLPFRTASTNQFTCTAHASGQMTVEVEPFPDNPWRRLRWRVLELGRRLSVRSQDSPA